MPLWGTSNEYPQHIFCGAITKILSLLSEATYNKENLFETGKTGLNCEVALFASGLNSGILLYDFLQHESRNKGMKHSWKKFPPIVEFDRSLFG